MLNVSLASRRPSTRSLHLPQAFSLALLALLLGGLMGSASTARAQSTGAVEGRVIDAETEEPLAGVNIVAAGTQHGTATGADGRYRLELEAGTQTLRASFVGYQAEDRQVTVEAGETTTADFSLAPGSTLEDVVVVGSRGARRSALESPVPVDAIDVDEVTALAPQDDLNQLLTYAVPSFQSNRQSSSDATEFIDPVSLRGLGPDQVLVLVNGKRRHKSALVNTLQTAGNGAAGTDLNAIPTTAIKRIEVLRDGAAAQYGSDAIAGVINVVLKEQTETLTANATAGIHQEGDGESVQVGANYGFGIGDDGFVNVTGEFADRGRTNRADGNELIIFDQSEYGNFFSYPGEGERDGRVVDNEILEERGLEREDFRFRVGQSAMQRASVMFNSEYGLGGEESDATLYAFGGLTYKNGIGAPFRRLPSDPTTNVPAFYPNGFQPELNSDLVDQALTAGVEGTLHGWTLDLSNTFGRNTLDYQVDNTINASLGTASPTSIYAGKTAFSQNTTTLDATRFFEDPLEGINVALGAAYRVGHYEIEAGEEASYRDYGRVQVIEDGQLVTRDTLDKQGGAQGFVGFRPESETNRTRTNVAAYADAEFNLTEALLVTTAGRFEHYSDFGSTLNGKLSARLSLLDEDLNLRGSASTGFRAPSLHQIHYARVTQDLSDGLLTEVGTFPNTSQVARTLGIEQLDEEQSRNLSLGLTARPLENLDVTIDGYYIEVDDRILLTGTFGGSEEIGALLDEVGATDARFFANAVDTETTGLDVVATYRQALPTGTLDLSGAFNYNETEAVSVNVPPTLEDQQETFFGPQEEALLETNSPRTTLNLKANYTLGRASALVRSVRFGEVTRHGGSFGGPQTHSAQWVFDLGLSYRLTDGVELAVGANNVFDNLPDEQIFGNSYLGVFDYAPVQQGFNGAFYFARLNLEL